MRSLPTTPLDVAAMFGPLVEMHFPPGVLNVLKQLSASPGLSYPKALGSALYKTFQRMLRQAEKLRDALLGLAKNVLPASVFLPPVLAESVSRARLAGVVLALHDSTECRFSGLVRREGLSRLNKNDQGFIAHITLATTADGDRIPIGVLGAEIMVRGEENISNQSDVERYNSPDKESLRWPRGMRAADATLGDAAVAIHVTDREGDDYTTYADCVAVGRRFIIRMRVDRVLHQKQGSKGPRNIGQAFAALTKGALTRDVPISVRGKDSRPDKAKDQPARAMRDAKLTFYAMPLPLKRPSHVSKDLPDHVNVHVVRVIEENPPEGEEAISWTLATTEPITTAEDIAFIVDAYRARWTIEEFFKALKTGCALEKRQLDSAGALVDALTLALPMATNLLLLRTTDRVTPERPAAELFSQDMIEVLRETGFKKLGPNPNCRELMRAVAALGGFLGGPKKQPGWLILGRGMETLMERTAAWKASREFYERQRGKKTGRQIKPSP